MPKKKKLKSSKRSSKKSLDLKALLSESEELFLHINKTLKTFSERYDLTQIVPKEADGDGYMFMVAKTKAKNKDTNLNWSQHNFNFPISAIAATIDGVSQATIKHELLNLFAQNLARQFAEKYGEDFASVITIKFYEWLEQEFGDGQKN